ncbi:MAG: hypothetical protein AAF989_05590 [Planctomycetota bacterium]
MSEKIHDAASRTEWIENEASEAERWLLENEQVPWGATSESEQRRRPSASQPTATSSTLVAASEAFNANDA